MATEINAVDAAESAVENGFDADGNISDENMAAALTGGEIELETKVETETDVKVETDVEQDDDKPGDLKDEPQGDPDTDKDDVPTGVQSKKGDFIIPYDDLIKERDGRHTERARADGLQEQLNAANKRLTEVTTPVAGDLETDKEPGTQDKDTPDKQKVISQEALDEMMEDYPQAGAAIMALVKSNELLVQQVGDLTNQSEDNAVTVALGEHVNTIIGVHNDYEAILDSGRLKEWINGLPALDREGPERVFNSGNTKEVIELVDKFKAETTSEDDPPKVDPDKKIADAEAKAANETNTPVSLSDIPGSVQPHDEQNALLEMSQGNFMDKMSNLSAADQLAALDKML